MKLIELLSSPRQLETIQKREIPHLLGELEEIKATLWMRLNEGEHIEVTAPPPKLERPVLDAAPVQRRMVRIPGVAEMTGLSRSSIWLRVRDGTFPRPKRLGPRAVAWMGTKVEDWIASRPTT